MEQFQSIINTLCEDVGTPRALAVKLLCESGEWTQLQELRLRNPGEYPGAESYFKDALVTELLRKAVLPWVSGDAEKRRKKAVETFWECEIQNYSTNVRLQRYQRDTEFLRDSTDVSVVHFIDEWRKDMKECLSGLPPFLTPLFSGGATYDDVGKLTTTPDKMSSRPTIYQNAIDLVPFFWETSWGTTVRDRGESPKIVRGNIFFTVRKDSEKDRGCAKEASIPVSYQLYVGRYLRGPLRKIGIDLTTGKETHMSLARTASLDDSLSTVDMSNASDTMSAGLVKLVLPPDWYMLLDSLRAKYTRVEGKWVRLEKFSSMGNGFTFELETLLFATLARTIVRLRGGDVSNVTCFGDDLIIPQENAADVLAALRFFGFTPNETKTYVCGPFRESCGGDYFQGAPVRALYLKKPPDEPQEWIAMANGLRRVDPLFRWVKRAWLKCLNQLPLAIRQCRGPETLGDLAIHDRPESWNFKNKVLTEGGESTRFFRTYSPVPKTLPWHHWHPDVVLSCTTLGIPSTGVTPRGGISGYKLGFTMDPCYSKMEYTGRVSGFGLM